MVVTWVDPKGWKAARSVAWLVAKLVAKLAAWKDAVMVFHWVVGTVDQWEHRHSDWRCG